MQMNAYDYERQEWAEGDRGRDLLILQLRDEVELLESSDGERYARMINGDRRELLLQRRAELEGLWRSTGED
jgi:hypothetical protein